MIFRNRVVEMKLVEQLTLVTLQTAHHASTSPRFASTQPNHASWPLSTDFCNKIGTSRTWRDVRLESVMRWWSQPVDATLYLKGEMECALMGQRFHRGFTAAEK